MKYHYFHRFFTNSVKRSLVASAASILALSLASLVIGGSVLITVSGGEFDWGGTSVKR